MRYEDFVNELRPLLQEAAVLLNLQNLHEEPHFRKWRHNVTDLIERIEDQGYEINSSIQNRYFDEPGSYTYDPTRKDRINAFNRDLQDTINEFETIIARFDKYGDPKEPPENAIETAEPLEWPQKITLSWLFKHAPIGLWFKAGGILLAAIILGITIGQSQLYKELSSKYRTDIEPNNQIQPTQKTRG